MPRVSSDAGLTPYIMELPDYFPRPNRRRDFYKNTLLEILVLSELQPDGMWRPRYVYTIVVGRKQYNNSCVGYDTTFGTPEQCQKFAHEMMLHELSTVFTWNVPATRLLKGQLQPFKNTLMILGIPTNCSIWPVHES